MHLLHRLSLVSIVIFLDQLSKWAVLGGLSVKEMVPITSFFNLALTLNRGVSFGFFPAHTLLGKGILVIIGVGFVSWLTVCLVRAETKLEIFSYSFIIGGALGNIVDRVRFGAVVDFLHFHLCNHSFPVFNIADSAITVGVALLFIQQAWHLRKKKRGHGFI